MSSTVPTEQELTEYKEALILRKEPTENENDEPYITKDNFIGVSSWFDENESNNDRPNSYAYPRVKNLKSIIFDTVKEDNDLVNIQEFVNLLIIKIPGKELKLYGDILQSQED